MIEQLRKQAEKDRTTNVILRASNRITNEQYQKAMDYYRGYIKALDDMKG